MSLCERSSQNLKILLWTVQLSVHESLVQPRLNSVLTLRWLIRWGIRILSIYLYGPVCYDIIGTFSETSPMEACLPFCENPNSVFKSWWAFQATKIQHGKALVTSYCVLGISFIFTLQNGMHYYCLCWIRNESRLRCSYPVHVFRHQILLKLYTYTPL